MAVTATVVMSEANGAWTPIRGVDRRSGPVGTYHAAATVTGAAGGGTAKVLLDGSFLMFGFHPLLVPRAVMARDNLSSSETVLLGFGSIGNERLTLEHFVIGRTTKTVTTININTWPLDDIALVIEPERAPSDPTVMAFTWATNTDTKIYSALVFFHVYDLEALSKSVGPVTGPTFLNE